MTEIRTNALGFRGAEWPSPGRGGSDDGRTRLLLLGDSQMFGYNVDEPSTLAAQLELQSGVRVLNAATPTHGPPDYVTALKELAPKYQPRFVLFVANAANDWFEPVPNRRRTTARDGWAASVGTPTPRWFPFREWVMRESHLVFGIREVARFAHAAQLPSAEAMSRLKTDLAKLRRGARVRGETLPSKDASSSETLEVRDRSTLTVHLRGAVAACAQIGCEVVAVALPSDVQVSPAEWTKYRAPAVDLADTEALLDDFVSDARALGIRALNLLPALRAAEPGAFLEDDYHLSAKGHRAVADALLPLLRLEEAALETRP